MQIADAEHFPRMLVERGHDALVDGGVLRGGGFVAGRGEAVDDLAGGGQFDQAGLGLGQSGGELFDPFAQLVGAGGGLVVLGLQQPQEFVDVHAASSTSCRAALREPRKDIPGVAIRMGAWSPFGGSSAAVVDDFHRLRGVFLDSFGTDCSASGRVGTSGQEDLFGPADEGLDAETELAGAVGAEAAFDDAGEILERAGIAAPSTCAAPTQRPARRTSWPPAP
ncbi:hypothetical protein [Streptomyces sp. MCC20]|uniref:hypothetical protein n=1 Tax=Streptomyces sediminimaris TaxID=3383721 RepID=UPI00399A382F